MRTAPFIAFLLFLATAGRAQSIQWMRDAGSNASNTEWGNSVDTDADGNPYIACFIPTDTWFSSMPVAAFMDGFIARYDVDGNLIWVHTFGGPGGSDISVTRLKVDKANACVYVCGQLRSTPLNPIIYFDTLTITLGGYDNRAFLAKYDLNGNILWVRHGGGSPYGATAYDLDIDEYGRIVCVGELSSTSTFDGQTLVNPTNQAQAYLVRYAPDGNLLNLHAFLSTDRAQPRAVEVATGSGAIHFGGMFRGSLTIGGNSTSAPYLSSQVFVARLDSSFNCQWIAQGGGSNPVYGSACSSLELDPFGNTFITGSAAGDTVTFGAHSFNGLDATNSDVITAKLDPTGNWQWLKHGGSIVTDGAMDLTTDSNGNSLVTGFLGGNVLSAQFDGVQIPISSQNGLCFLARYDTDGNLAWSMRMGTGIDEIGRGIAFHNDSLFHLTGSTHGVTQFDTLLHMPCCNDPNIFLARFHELTPDITLSVAQGDGALERSALLTVTPVPASDRVYLSAITSPADMQVLDANGRIVLRSLKGGVIDVGAWSDGLYVVRDASGIAARFVVQH